MNTPRRGLRGFGPFLVAVVELIALVVVAGWIGFGWAFLLLLSTSVVGLALLRLEGFRAWATLRQAAADGRLDDAGEDESERSAATSRIADTGVRILSGLLLTLPGFVTDIFALVLLIPPVRRSMGRRLSAAAFRTFPGRMTGTGGRQGVEHHPAVIEGEVVDSDRRERRPNGN